MRYRDTKRTLSHRRRQADRRILDAEWPFLCGAKLNLPMSRYHPALPECGECYDCNPEAFEDLVWMALAGVSTPEELDDLCQNSSPS